VDRVEDCLSSLFPFPSISGAGADMSPDSKEAIESTGEQSEVEEERVDSPVLSLIFPTGHLGDAVEGVLGTELLREEQEEEVAEVEVGEGEESLCGGAQEGEGVLSSADELGLVEVERGEGRGGWGWGRRGRVEEERDSSAERGGEEREEHGEGVSTEEEELRGG
jgi:hypothetical protein